MTPASPGDHQHSVMDAGDPPRVAIQSRRVRGAGFTLIELLVASAVMALLLALMLQVINGVLMASRTQNQQMESTSSARLALDVMGVDLQQAVVGGNATILLPTNPGAKILALLSTRLRPSSATDAGHRFLAIAYSTNSSNQLFRSYGSVPFTESNLIGNLTNYPTNTPVEPLAGGVLAIQIQALGDGTNSYPITNSTTNNWATNNYNGWSPPAGYTALLTHTPDFGTGLTNRTHSLQVWIASIDNRNYRLLSLANKLSTAQNALNSSDPTTWRSNIDAAAIPAQTKSGIRILTKTIPVP